MKMKLIEKLKKTKNILDDVPLPPQVQEPPKFSEAETDIIDVIGRQPPKQAQEAQEKPKEIPIYGYYNQATHETNIYLQMQIAELRELKAMIKDLLDILNKDV